MTEKKKTRVNWEKWITAALMIWCGAAAAALLVRTFFGTELTDEAFYVSDAVTMMHGNTLYSFDNYFSGSGFTLLTVPFIFVFELFSPDRAGIVLYLRICYVLVWLSVLYCAYRVLRKDFKKTHVLLALSLLIPAAGATGLFNFSYNTTPQALAFLGGLLIYDALEHGGKHTAGKFIASGFVLCLALMGHPLYVTAVAVFSVMILVRSKGTGKIRNILLCVSGGLLQALVVVAPIVLRTGISVFVSGVSNLLHPYPQPKVAGYMTKGEKLNAVFPAFRDALVFCAVSFLIALVVLGLLSLLKKKYPSGFSRYPDSLARHPVLAAWGFAFLALLADRSLTLMKSGTSLRMWMMGVAGSVLVAGFFLGIKAFRKPVLYYFGIYPVVFCFLLLLETGSSSTLTRFSGMATVLFVCALLLLETDVRPVKALAIAAVLVSVPAMFANEYQYVYRDGKLPELRYRVEEGVYQGIYTTEARARDLPELERYLNRQVPEDESYAFRDNVPAGYLMMHQGRACDRATWDCMQYTYHKNAPANLYAYYQRRGAIPQTIIYVDYGRDDHLSIDDEGFLYNEFVNSYYELAEETELNETFSRVKIYKYTGGFDGNLDYWIDRHMYHPT